MLPWGTRPETVISNIKSLIDRLQGVYGNGQTYEEMSQSNKDAVNILFQGLFQYTAVKIIRFFNSDLRSTIAKNAQLEGSADILADKERYVSDILMRPFQQILGVGSLN